MHCNFSFSPSSQELRPAAKNLQGCGPCILHPSALVNGNNPSHVISRCTHYRARNYGHCHHRDHQNTLKYRIDRLLYMASGRLDADLRSVFYKQRRHASKTVPVRLGAIIAQLLRLAARQCTSSWCCEQRSQQVQAPEHMQKRRDGIAVCLVCKKPS